MKKRPRHSSLRYGKPSPFVKDRKEFLAMLCVGLIGLSITLAVILGQTARELRIAEAMQGIEYKHSDAFIDEIPGAYKDINFVMENSRELVKIVHELKQILNVKGN